MAQRPAVLAGGAAEGARLAARDPAAWGAFYEGTVDDLHAYLCARIGRSRAPDVVQESYLEAMRGIGRWDPARGDPRGGSPRGWLFGIARRQAARFLDRDRRAREAWAAAGREALREIDGGGSGPDGEGEDERRRFVRTAFLSLPASQQAILRAKYHEGRSVREIAAGAGQGEKVVESALTRAREALREALRREADATE